MMEISLRRWAEARYGDDAPCDNTLRTWARNGFIFPVPRKQGRAYYVREDAVYLRPGETPPPHLLPAVVPQPRGRLVGKLMNEQQRARKVA